MLLSDLSQTVKQNVETLIEQRTFSFSRLSLIEQCLFAFFLKYVLQLKVNEDTLPLLLGKAVHKAIEEKLKGMKDKDALMAGMKEIDYFPVPIKEYVMMFENAKVKQGAGLAPNAIVEHHFKVPLSEDKDTTYLQGYIDYLENIFGAYNFIDWKSNRFMYEPSETMQLALYAYALRKEKGAKYVTGSLYFLRHARFQGYRKSKNYTVNEMEQARVWAYELSMDALLRLESFVNGGDSNDLFPHKVNSKCQYCPFAHICVESHPITI